MTDLEIFEKRFNDIKNSTVDNYIKSIRLAALMTDMETVYAIPLVGHERIDAFRRAYPEVMQLYRAASYERAM